MKTLTIHCGIYKTGSTTLQHIFKNTLDEQNTDLLYIKSGRLTHWPLAHHQLFEDMQNGQYATMNAVIDELLLSDKNQFLISCEELMWPDKLASLRYLVSQLPNFNIKIRLIFRNYFEFFQSLYLERIKRDQFWLPFENFLYIYGRSLSFADMIQNFFSFKR